jgi:hypothetical protein
MIARPRGKPIHYLQNLRLWIWLLIGGGAAVFIGFVMTLALLHPDTPANELITWWNGWVLVIPVGMMAAGVYMSARWWCCPKCGWPLPTRSPIPERCPRCSNALRDA